MTESKIPKDIRSYKTKILGPLSFRQLICGLIAVTVDIILWFGVFQGMDISPRALIMIGILIDLPILAFSFEIEGMTMETYLMEIIDKNFIRPSKRIAKSDALDNSNRNTIDTKEKKKHKKEIARRIQANPEFKPYK